MVVDGDKSSFARADRDNDSLLILLKVIQIVMFKQ